MESLVTTAWLAEHLGAPDLRIADATLLDPALGRDAAAEFAAGHLPGAVFLDLAELRDTASPLPNTLPGPGKLASRLGRLGLGDGTRIVLYDDSPWHSAARAWWLIHRHRIGQVAILDGGIARWRREGRPLDTALPAPRPRHATPDVDKAALRTLAQMRANLSSGAEQVIDARSAARFAGTAPDPHGAAPGHIPGSRNLPYGHLLNGDGTWKRPAELAAAFAEIGVDPAAPAVATCGSGVTAAVLAFAAHLLGHEMAIYDGSWSEWGADPTLPKAMGAAA